MADTTTLQPLTRQERTSLRPQSDDELLAQARERFAWAEEAEADERQQHLAALTFRAGNHWGNVLRGNEGDGVQSDRLEMVIDRLNPMIQQALNAYRKSPLAMRVRPKGGGASKQVADMIEGHLRDIEQQSEGGNLLHVAPRSGRRSGPRLFPAGARVRRRLQSFQQVLRIRPLYNRFAVYCRPCQRPSCRAWTWSGPSSSTAGPPPNSCSGTRCPRKN